MASLGVAAPAALGARLAARPLPAVAARAPGAAAAPRAARLVTEAKRQCQLTGKKANNGYSISFSHTRNKKLQQPNLQWKKIWYPEGNCFIKLKISTEAIKTLRKRGLKAMAKEAGIDLNKARRCRAPRGTFSLPGDEDAAPAEMTVAVE